MVGTVVKAKIGGLKEAARAGFLRMVRKDFTGVFQGIYGKNMFKVRFQDRCKKYLTSNQLTIVIVEKIPVVKEPDLPTNTEIPEEQVKLEKGYYLCVYVVLQVKREFSVDSKEDQSDMDDDPDEEDMDDFNDLYLNPGAHSG